MITSTVGVEYKHGSTKAKINKAKMWNRAAPQNRFPAPLQTPLVAQH
jgi:hypothetical protein